MSNSVYCLADGRLTRENNTLRFDRTGDVGSPRFYPIEQCRDVYVMSSVEIPLTVLTLLQEAEIPVHVFHHHTQAYLGSFWPSTMSGSGSLLLAQVHHMENPTDRLYLASQFVDGAVFHMIRVLTPYGKRHPVILPLIETLTQTLPRLSTATSIEQLMGMEGSAHATYFRAWASVATHPDWTWERRSRRPPHDSMNALLSFLNALMYSTVLSELYKTRLDPRIGFLHSTNLRSHTLHLDVAEIFRPLIADRIWLTLINKHILTPTHVDRRVNGLRLTPDGRKLVLQAWEDKLRDTFEYPALGRAVSYRTLIRLECYKLEKHLWGDQTYQALHFRW